jgi:hypothetical protein
MKRTSLPLQRRDESRHKHFGVGDAAPLGQERARGVPDDPIWPSNTRASIPAVIPPGRDLAESPRRVALGGSRRRRSLRLVGVSPIDLSLAMPHNQVILGNAQLVLKPATLLNVCGGIAGAEDAAPMQRRLHVGDALS